MRGGPCALAGVVPGLSPAPAAGGLDGYDGARFKVAARLRGELLAVEEVPAGRSGLSSLGSSRSVAAAVGEEREARGLKDAHGADDAVAAPVLDAGGAPVAGVSLTVDAGRMGLDAFVALAKPEVLQVARELTDALRHSAGAIAAGGVR